ncbi:MAG: hypothetical protein AAFV46_08495, partial [Cyanobacteria bacterium J06635_11]
QNHLVQNHSALNGCFHSRYSIVRHCFELTDQHTDRSDRSNQNNALQLNNGYGNNRLAQNGSVQGGSVQNSSALSVNTNNRVYGKDQVSQLLSTLFPNRVT